MDRGRLHLAAVAGVKMQVLQVAVEGDGEAVGVAKPAAMLQRLCHRRLDVLGRDVARPPRHRDLLDVPGVDADHLVGAQRREDLRGRDRAGGAEIGRAVDRDLRRLSGIVDEVADPHHVGGDGDGRMQHRRLDGIVERIGVRCREAAEQRSCQQEGAKFHRRSPLT